MLAASLAFDEVVSACLRCDDESVRWSHRLRLQSRRGGDGRRSRGGRRRRVGLLLQLQVSRRRRIHTSEHDDTRTTYSGWSLHSRTACPADCHHHACAHESDCSWSVDARAESQHGQRRFHAHAAVGPAEDRFHARSVRGGIVLIMYVCHCQPCVAQVRVVACGACWAGELAASEGL